MKKSYRKPIITSIPVCTDSDLMQASSHRHSVTGQIIGEGENGSDLDMEWGGKSNNDSETDPSGNIWGD